MNCTLKEIQNKQCEILRELNRVSKKNNIDFFLAQGTLLGAARGGCFIPWDDDVDTMISCFDLDRLMEVFPKETNGDYLLTNHKVEKHYQYTWAKIRAGGTLSRPVKYKAIPVHWGVCLDLFPIYPLSDVALFRKVELFLFKLARKMLLAEMTKYEDGHGAVTRLFEHIPIPVRHWAVNFATGLMRSHKKDTEYVFLTAKGGHVMKRNIIFGEKKTLTFEGDEYLVPADYDAFLRQQYGDYMTPPPASEQGGHDLKMGDIEWSVNYTGKY